VASIRALKPREHFGLSVQRMVGWICSPITTLAVHWLVRVRLGLTLEDPSEVRRVYRELYQNRDTPLLLCANHLTLVDSALIAWMLGAPATYVMRFRALPWNVPETSNFAATWSQRVMSYVYKCIPIERGGDRSAVASTLARFSEALSRGDTGLIFPEAGRSRSGRVEIERAAYGVGRVVRSLPGCRVLCVYLRGDQQETYSDFPAYGDHLRARTRIVEPKTDHRGLRGSVDIARQITQTLAELEAEHFASHPSAQIESTPLEGAAS
jgi:hypothetical protein